VDEQPIFESAVIVEYLEETQPNPLHPTDPVRRAQHRAWVEFGSSILSDVWTVETTADQAAFESKRKAIAEKFQRVEQALGAGPFFEGQKFSVVDAVFAPIFRYFDVFEAHTQLGVFDGLTKVPAWRKALAARASVRDAVVPDYPARLEAFLRRQNGHFTGLMKKA
jgi:glutathione S-transferase